MNDHRISRRSFLAAAGIAGAAAALTACGGAASSTAASVASSAAASSQAAQSVELIVFAAASLTETLTAIGETPEGDGVELLDQLNRVSGVTVPRRLAALKGKARRFDQWTEKDGMDDVVLNFLR